MLKKFSTRRQFLNYGKLSLLLLLSSCSNSTKKIRIAFQNSFYPKSLKDSLPKNWQQENINLTSLKLEKNKNELSSSDFILINDGWLDVINFEDLQNINELTFNNKLDNRSKDFLDSFKEHQRNKLFPIGVIPYAVIIKNNKELINKALNSWDFLLDENLKGKIIFPRSPRVIMSIARKINIKESLKKLQVQAMLFDDQNSINWLINSNASVAIVPYSVGVKYLQYDSRLSIVFPNKGVPLMWNFLLSKSKSNNRLLIDWIKSLDKKSVIDDLANEGWYLPFKNEYSQDKFYIKNPRKNYVPSKMCWENSWSFPILNSKEKFKLETLWNESLTP